MSLSCYQNDKNKGKREKNNRERGRQKNQEKKQRDCESELRVGIVDRTF